MGRPRYRRPRGGNRPGDGANLISAVAFGLGGPPSRASSAAPRRRLLMPVSGSSRARSSSTIRWRSMRAQRTNVLEQPARFVVPGGCQCTAAITTAVSTGNIQLCPSIAAPRPDYAKTLQS